MIYGAVKSSNLRAESESEVAPPCPTLCNPMDCSLPGSSIHGIFQAPNEYSGLISFRIDWFEIFPVQGTLKSLL